MRLPKDDYYLGVAKSICKRATCSRRRFGAIIVNEDVIVSTGYNGAARKVKDCFEWGICLKDEVGAPQDQWYDLCIAVHAEENAIINAARNGSSVLGGTLYLYGENCEDGTITEAKPCDRCRRAIINAGIQQVVTKKADDTVMRYDVSDWVYEDTNRYGKNIKRYLSQKG